MTSVGYILYMFVSYTVTEKCAAKPTEDGTTLLYNNKFFML
jgi:hypothetical protein